MIGHDFGVSNTSQISSCLITLIKPFINVNVKVVVWLGPNDQPIGVAVAGCLSTSSTSSVLNMLVKNAKVKCRKNCVFNNEIFMSMCHVCRLTVAFETEHRKNFVLWTFVQIIWKWFFFSFQFIFFVMFSLFIVNNRLIGWKT